MSMQFYDKKYYEKLVDAYKTKSRWARDRINNVLELANPKPKNVILDLGCGIGTFTIECSKLVTKVVGVDFSKGALLTAKNLIKFSGNPLKAEFVYADIRCLPFKGNIFDTIICADLVEHLYPSRYHLFLLEAHRVLKNVRTIVVYTPNSSHIFEILRKRNILLKKDETHVNFKSFPYLLETLRKNHFTLLKSYYKESHIPIFNIIEKILMRIPIISPFFRRRICILASKR